MPHRREDKHRRGKAAGRRLRSRLTFALPSRQGLNYVMHAPTPSPHPMPLWHALQITLQLCLSTLRTLSFFGMLGVLSPIISFSNFNLISSLCFALLTAVALLMRPS